MTKTLFSVILDVRKKERTMSYVTETLTEKLRKTDEENHGLAQEVEGMYICNLLSRLE